VAKRELFVSVRGLSSCEVSTALSVLFDVFIVKSVVIRKSGGGA